MQELPNSLRTEASSPLRGPPFPSYLHTPHACPLYSERAPHACPLYLERTRGAPMYCSSARASALAAGDIMQTCIKGLSIPFLKGC